MSLSWRGFREIPCLTECCTFFGLTVSNQNFTYFTVTYVQQVLDKIKELQYGSLASVVGRYYAMDRDKRFERNKIAFEGLVQGIGEVATPETIIEVCIIYF